MKVRIKSKEEIKRISLSDPYDTDCYHIDVRGVYFIPEMFEYCEKTFDLKFYKTYCNKKIYKIVSESNSFSWEGWMFDVLPEVDKNNNYLLEF